VPWDEKTSLRGQVFWCSLKISSGSTWVWDISACTSACPLAHFGIGFFARSSSSSLSLSDVLLHHHHPDSASSILVANRNTSVHPARQWRAAPETSRMLTIRQM
jgi:hypothetical protein